MFAFLKEWFKDIAMVQQPDKMEALAVSVIGIPGGNRRVLRFDPALIPTLRAEHAELITMYGNLWALALDTKNYELLSANLGEFKRKFQAHLLKENVKFYVYLEQSLADNQDAVQIVKELRADMNEIANAVITFCKKYQSQPIRRDLISQFEHDYIKVGKVLTKRVRLEEKELYTLYQDHEGLS